MNINLLQASLYGIVPRSTAVEVHDLLIEPAKVPVIVLDEQTVSDLMYAYTCNRNIYAHEILRQKLQASTLNTLENLKNTVWRAGGINGALNEDGHTLLHRLAFVGDSVGMQSLLKLKPNIYVKTATGGTVLDVIIGVCIKNGIVGEKYENIIRLILMHDNTYSNGTLIARAFQYKFSGQPATIRDQVVQYMKEYANILVSNSNLDNSKSSL